MSVVSGLVDSRTVCGGKGLSFVLLRDLWCYVDPGSDFV